MSISITRYVNITSGVGGAATFGSRDLILRIFTTNAAVPPASVITFDNGDDMLKLFASNSAEYQIGSKYFAFISKLITRPTKLSVVRWPKAALAPVLFGDLDFTPSLARLKTISAGNLALAIDGVAANIPAIDLSTATSLADVATKLQTEIRKNTDPMLATATVSINTNGPQFVLTGATSGSPVVISCQAASSADVGALLGWNTDGAVFAPGASSSTPVQLLAQNTEDDDNFGSFTFVDATAVETNIMIEAAQWNHEQNNKFMFCLGVTPGNAATVADATKGFSGLALTLIDTTKPDDHPETIPAEILAATNWNRANASGNYMFYEYGNRSATVKSNTDANKYDALRVNYVGETQSAGKKVSFYQRGYLQGDGRAAVDMNVYAGEQWLKSALVAKVMNMFLAMPNVPATDIGRIMVLGVMQEPLDQALTNGVFAPGKVLTALQKAYVGQVTGNDTAWINVQNKGYFIDAKVVEFTGPSNRVEYRLDYVLVYSKNDQIRKVEGSDILV